MRGSMVRPRGSIALAALFGLGLATAGPAGAADDGYANVFSALFSALGVVRPDPAPVIAYRERAPLVLPPQNGLPKPATGTRRDAAWPQDPDVVRLRKEVEEARAPRFGVGDHVELLSADERAKGRGESADAAPSSCRADSRSQRCLLVNPDDLKAMGERYEASNTDAGDALVAGKEPDRVYLTQPPKGYRTPTKVLKATNDGPRRVLDASNPRASVISHKTDDE